MGRDPRLPGRAARGNATLTDLMDSLGGASGRDLNMWRHEWLQTFGPDRFTLRQEADQKLILLGSGPQGRPVRPQVITVGAYRRDEDRLRELATADVEVTTAATPVDLPADADLYLVNNRDLTYATSRPRTRDRDLIVRHAGDLPDSLARGVAAATAYDMLLAGEANTADVVHGLCEVVQRENSTSIIEAYLNLAADLAEHWCPEGTRDVLTSQVAAVCAQLAGDPSHRRVALRVMTRVGDKPTLDDMADSAATDVDLQWRLLCRRAELGCITEGQIGDLLAGDPDPDAWVSAPTVQACGP